MRLPETIVDADSLQQGTKEFSHQLQLDYTVIRVNSVFGSDEEIYIEKRSMRIDNSEENAIHIITFTCSVSKANHYSKI